MPVAEHFVSVNGEGPRAGRLAAFVRFRGCNLRCSYCDTAWAIDAEGPAEQLTVVEIVAWVRQTGAACVTLTGGEPALQPLLPDLVRALMALPPVEGGEGWRPCPLTVEIETNGSVPLDELAMLRSEAYRAAAEADGAPGSRLAFTMDWKLPSSGMEQNMRAENFALLNSNDAVKFVVGSRADLEEMLRTVRAHGLCDRCAVFASPVFGRIDPAEIADFLREQGLAQVRLQLQLHKIIWPNVEKGV